MALDVLLWGKACGLADKVAEIVDGEAETVSTILHGEQSLGKGLFFS